MKNCRKILTNTIACAVVICSAVACSGEDVSAPKVEESLTQIPFNEVALEDEFWLPRLQNLKEVLVPFSFEKTEYAVDNLRRVGAYLRGERVTKPLEGRYYVSSDLFKVMEGAACLLTLERDAELEAKMDEIIDIIAAAQKSDGYLYEHHIMPKHLRNPSNNRSTGERPYAYVAHSHELYNMGHMYEGAIAYYRATGKRKWLDVAEKSAQHINRVFFEGDPNYNGGKPVMQAPGHEEIELALVKMYQVTGNKLYLDMAQKFVDIRGVTWNTDGKGVNSGSYAQQHLPVREQREVIGHAVRATYLYSGMADLVAINGDTTLMPALDAVWHDIVDKKMHITGGLGAVAAIEGFGPAYELPNKHTYNETCSALGNVLFNYRMYLMSGDAKYVDVAEVSLYNNVLAGVNLEGNRFFYVNPLEADGRRAFNHGRAGRSPWFSTACCPSNLARLIPQISGMVYSHTDDDIFCSFYVGSSVEVPLKAGAVKLHQQTEYPFEGEVAIEVEPAVDGEEFTLWLRIPSWVNDRFVPGELYSYADGVRSRYSVEVNGCRVRSEVVDGFLPLHRKWSAGDKVCLSLPMKVRYAIADERVKADSNRLCVTRGPLVFCAEEPDNEAPVSRCYISSLNSKRGKVSRFEEGVLSGIPTITIAADVAYDEKCEPTSLKLIPYYAWNNRGDNQQMNVWFGRDAATSLAGIVRLPRNVADVKASYTNSRGDDVVAVMDGKVPTHSHDKSILRWTSWRQQGKDQHIEITFKKAQPVECVSVYWYDDKGGVQLPKEWSIDYLANGEWHEYKPYITDHFGTALDQFNMVHPAEPIVAEALRLNMTPKDKDTAVGILELTIE
ncbi:MAG: glycoside hydrolase family 127 protein [Alistipes sp.]|nr:glycoside hydrolase family 127 protein [Alistipes sp.]